MIYIHFYNYYVQHRLPACLLIFVYSQVEEILNFAMLTGVTQTYPLRVYLVRDTDTLMDATGHAACHSKETDVLKVGLT